MIPSLLAPPPVLSPPGSHVGRLGGPEAAHLPPSNLEGSCRATQLLLPPLPPFEQEAAGKVGLPALLDVIGLCGTARQLREPLQYSNR